MGVIAKLLRNFWVCLSMAVFSLLALWTAVLEGSAFWIAVDVFCVVYWVFAAHRTTKPELPLTDEQMDNIREITQQFSRDVSEIFKEAEDESNRRKDKEEDKKEPKDE